MTHAITLEDILNDYYSINVRPRNSFAHKIGHLAGKTVRCFSSQEAKLIGIISCWSVETVLTLLVILQFSGFFLTAFIIISYLYTSAAYFIVVDTLTSRKTWKPS